MLWVMHMQEAEEAEEDEGQEREQALRDSIASLRWMRGQGGSAAGDPLKKQHLQQLAGIKR